MIKAMLFLRKDSPICSKQTIEKTILWNTLEMDAAKKHKCLLWMPEMISLAFESDWHLTSHWVKEGFVLFTPPMQICSNLAALRLHFREKQHSTALLIRPYAHPMTFLLTSWPHMYVSMQISAPLDTEGLVGRHMTQIQSIICECICCKSVHVAGPMNTLEWGWWDHTRCHLFLYSHFSFWSRMVGHGITS